MENEHAGGPPALRVLFGDIRSISVVFGGFRPFEKNLCEVLRRYPAKSDHRNKKWMRPPLSGSLLGEVLAYCHQARSRGLSGWFGTSAVLFEISKKANEIGKIKPD